MSKLVGTKPYQTPRNSDLGTLAYQNHDTTILTDPHFDGIIQGESHYYQYITGITDSSYGDREMFQLALGNYSGRSALIEMMGSCKSGTGGVRTEYKRSIWYENGGLTMIESSLDSVGGSNMDVTFATSGTTVIGRLKTVVATDESFSFWFRITGNIAKDSITVLYTP
jgi:hypothetical protein